MMMQQLWALCQKELRCHFAHSMAIIFIFAYLALGYYWVMYPGAFFERNLADYGVFLEFQPYLLLFLLPALTMNLWALERQTSTIEILLTLPVSNTTLVLSKFAATFCIVLIAMIGTFPFWGLLNYLGEPDNATIALGYIGLLLLAALYIAIGQFFALLSRSPLGGFVMTMLTLVAFLFIGEPAVYAVIKPFLSTSWIDIIQGFSLLNHYQVFIDGYFTLSDVFYFLLSIITWLWLASLLAHYQQVAK